jgi:hypothetical protein
MIHWVENDWIFTTGTKSCSVLSIYSVNLIYFSYKICIQSLKVLHTAIVKL